MLLEHNKHRTSKLASDDIHNKTMEKSYGKSMQFS